MRDDFLPPRQCWSLVFCNINYFYYHGQFSVLLNWENAMTGCHMTTVCTLQWNLLWCSWVCQLWVCVHIMEIPVIWHSCGQIIVKYNWRTTQITAFSIIAKETCNFLWIYLCQSSPRAHFWMNSGRVQWSTCYFYPWAWGKVYIYFFILIKKECILILTTKNQKWLPIHGINQ